MKRIWMILVAALTALVLSGCCCFADRKVPSRVVRNIIAGPIAETTRTVALDDAQRVRVEITFAGGDLDVDSGSEDLLHGEFRCNLPELAPVVEYDVAGDRGTLVIRQETDALTWNRVSTEVRNEWRLSLSDQVPLELSADVGASSGHWELGGLQIADLDLTVGAADLTLRFGAPNPEPLRRLHVRSGAARLQFLELGNANLDELAFDGGLGSYTFDFTGDWQRSARARIVAGASQIELRVPREIGVRVCAGDLPRVDWDGLVSDGECHVNRAYQDAEVTLDIDLDMGLGRLVVRQN